MQQEIEALSALIAAADSRHFADDIAVAERMLADLRAGNLVRREDAVAEERARVVAYLTWRAENRQGSGAGLFYQEAAQAIAAGAHEVKP